MGNTGLPYNPDTPQDVIDQVKAFRESDVQTYCDVDAKGSKSNGWALLSMDSTQGTI